LQHVNIANVRSAPLRLIFATDRTDRIAFWFNRGAEFSCK